MSAIPLVRVRYADSFAQSRNRLGAPTERLLNRVNLTGQILRKQHGHQYPYARIFLKN